MIPTNFCAQQIHNCWNNFPRFLFPQRCRQLWINVNHQPQQGTKSEFRDLLRPWESRCRLLRCRVAGNQNHPTERMWVRLLCQLRKLAERGKSISPHLNFQLSPDEDCQVIRSVKLPISSNRTQLSVRKMSVLRFSLLDVANHCYCPKLITRQFSENFFDLLIFNEFSLSVFPLAASSFSISSLKSHLLSSIWRHWWTFAPLSHSALPVCRCFRHKLNFYFLFLPSLQCLSSFFYSRALIGAANESKL